MSPAATLDHLRKISHEKHVIHGSPYFFEEKVKPRQGFCASGDPLNNQNAVYATLIIEVAVLRAVIREDRDMGASQIGWEIRRNKFYVFGFGLVFKPGWIYVLPREHFETHRDGLVCIAHRPIRATEIIPVEPDILKLLPGIELAHNLRF